MHYSKRIVMCTLKLYKQFVSFYVCVISELCILSQHAHVIVHFYMSTLAKESAASRGQIYSIY